MPALTRASTELFRRQPDECFETFDALLSHCQTQQEQSKERWHPPKSVVPTNEMSLAIGDDGDYLLNDWSFSQLCRLAKVSKDTINRLTPKTASRALRETLPASSRPIQLLTCDQHVRSIHGVSYTRLWNAELLSAIREAATDFEPPPKGSGEATGLYCGQQDLFCFLIDPGGWAEIDGEAFAPGFLPKIFDRVVNVSRPQLKK